MQKLPENLRENEEPWAWPQVHHVASRNMSQSAMTSFVEDSSKSSKGSFECSGFCIPVIIAAGGVLVLLLLAAAAMLYRRWKKRRKIKDRTYGKMNDGSTSDREFASRFIPEVRTQT